MTTFNATSDLHRMYGKQITMNRRTAFTLAIGGAASLASQSGQARAETPTVVQLENLKAVGAERRVVTIKHRGDNFVVLTADGQSALFSEINLRFKIDSSDRGPDAGSPVILPGGMMGDRATVFCASPMEIGSLIKHET